jgi:hypothetical protein
MTLRAAHAIGYGREIGLNFLYPAAHRTLTGTSRARTRARRDSLAGPDGSGPAAAAILRQSEPHRAVLVAALLALSAALVTPAAAQPARKSTADEKGGPTVNDEARKAAQRAFAAGQRAFKQRDFKHAAESFEAAYKSAPHPDALWNAARSWFRAGEKPRAANLYAQYLEEAPPNAPDRNSAIDALRELSPQLARLEIHATDVEDIQVDNQPLTRPSLYVTPGTHLIQGRHGDQVVKKSQEVAPGAIVSIALAPPNRPEPANPPPSRPSPSPAPPPPSPALPRSHGLSPLVLPLGGGLTAGAAGVLIWSGLDTLHQKKVFDANKTQDNLDAGRTKQLRTNVMIGVTAGLGALTVVTGLFFVDWRRGERETKKTMVEVGLGPGYITVRRTF